MANDLLDYGLDAHGGLNHWNELHSLSGYASVGGLLWQQKGRPGVVTQILGTSRRGATVYVPRWPTPH